MAEIKSNIVIYKYDSEGRDAFWSALKDSFDRETIAQNKMSRPEKVFCDSSQYEYQCNDVELRIRNDSEEPLTVSPPQTPVTPQTSDKTDGDLQTNYSTATTPTTPPPPPPLQSPPPLRHRSATLQRRRSSAGVDSWSLEHTAKTHKVTPTWLKTPLTFGDTWLDDFASATRCADKDCKNNDGDGDDNGRQNNAADEAEARGVGNVHGDSRESANDDGDGGEVVETTAQTKSPTSVDDKDEDYDDPIFVNDDDHHDQRYCNDSGINQLYYDIVGDISAAVSYHNKPLTEYEMKVKEIDKNIAYYSKRFICTVMFFVLFRILY